VSLTAPYRLQAASLVEDLDSKVTAKSYCLDPVRKIPVDACVIALFLSSGILMACLDGLFGQLSDLNE
jgi:hypothetical protein